jgi:tetratricopeptide (TPR) repeat protein
LGYLHRELKHFIKAIEYCNLAIAQSPKWIMPRITLMKTYRLMGGQMERYEEVAQEIVRIDSNSYLARYNLGVAYSNSKKWSKAEEEYKVALAISPNDRETLFNISFVYYQQSKWAEAEKAVATLMQLDPNDLELCIPMACLLIKKGKEEEAFKTIETSVVKGFRGFEDIESEADLSELVKTEKYLSLKKKYASSE